MRTALVFVSAMALAFVACDRNKPAPPKSYGGGPQSVMAAPSASADAGAKVEKPPLEKKSPAAPPGNDPTIKF